MRNGRDRRASCETADPARRAVGLRPPAGGVTVSSPLRANPQGMRWNRTTPPTKRWRVSRYRSARLRRIRRWAPLSALAVAVLLLALTGPSHWPLLTKLRHIAAYPNCAAARAVGLAPAYRGQPGYWPSHDRDSDGIACEPWPRPSRRLPKVIRGRLPAGRRCCYPSSAASGPESQPNACRKPHSLLDVRS